MMVMDDDDNDADEHDIIYVIHVMYIKAWAAGVASLKVSINDDASVSLNSSIMNMMMMKVMVMDVSDDDNSIDDNDNNIVQYI